MHVGKSYKRVTTLALFVTQNHTSSFGSSSIVYIINCSIEQSEKYLIFSNYLVHRTN